MSIATMQPKSITRNTFPEHISCNVAIHETTIKIASGNILVIGQIVSLLCISYYIYVPYLQHHRRSPTYCPCLLLCIEAEAGACVAAVVVLFKNNLYCSNIYNHSSKPALLNKSFIIATIVSIFRSFVL